MNDNIERALFHSVGVVDYYINNLTINADKLQKIIGKIENILDIKDDERDYILDSIKEKTENFEMSEITTTPNKDQLDYLIRINKKKLNKPFVNEMNIIRKISCKFDKSSDLADAKDVLFKLSSFPFCHLVDHQHDIFETVRITEDVFFYLNLISKVFPSLEDEANHIKELYFPIFYSYIINNYFSEKENFDFDIVSLIMDFNKNDIDSLLGMSDRLYPTIFIENLRSELDNEKDMELKSGLTIDGEHKFFGDAPGDGQGYFLQFILMTIDCIFEEDYESLYQKFMSCDISNMYLTQAIAAQYNNKKSHGKMLIKHVVKQKLIQDNIPVYEELKTAFEAPGRKLFKSKDLSEKIAGLLLNDEENILPNLLTELDTPLASFCIHHLIGDILEDVRFTANDIEFLLNYSKNTVRAYLLKPSTYILKKDISELYKMSVLLLNLNLLDESRMLINKLIEMSKNDEDLFNEDELKILESQLKLLELSLGYIK